MEHNSLTNIAYARPIIYAEGLFVSCYLEEGEFVPEEGISQTDLWNILSGELLKSGSELVEDYNLKTKLNRLKSINKNTFELEQFPREKFLLSSSCNNIEDEDANSNNSNSSIDSNKKSGGVGINPPSLTEQQLTNALSNARTPSGQLVNIKDKETIPMFQMDSLEAEKNFINTQTTTEFFSSDELKLRKKFEQQVSWIMGEDGEEFVSTETFSRFTDALILLDVLKEFNVPSVVSFLARRDEPIALTYSKTKIGLDCLMFCLFQA